jgi:hypothetical protein
MSPAQTALVVLLGSLGWACFSFAREERAYRREWRQAPVPQADVGEPPYRVASVGGQPLECAPFLVKAAALACLWIGQGVFVLMLVPSILFRTSLTAFLLGGQSPELGTAGIVFRLGPLLLRRHRGATVFIAGATTLLQYWAVALLVFPLLGLNTDKAPIFWLSMLCMGGLCALLAGALKLLTWRCRALFESDVPALVGAADQAIDSGTS